MPLLARLIQNAFLTLKFHLTLSTRLIPKISTVAGFPCHQDVSYQRIWPSLQNHATRTFCTKAFTCRQYSYHLIHTFALKGSLLSQRTMFPFHEKASPLRWNSMPLLARLIQNAFLTLKFHLTLTRLIPKVSTVAGFPCHQDVSYQRIWPSLQNHATRTFCTKAFTCRQYFS